MFEAAAIIYSYTIVLTGYFNPLVQSPSTFLSISMIELNFFRFGCAVVW